MLLILLMHLFSRNVWRQGDRVAMWSNGYRVLDLKSGDPEFMSRSNHQVALGSTPRLQLHIATWSAYCQLGFLTCSVTFLYPVDICIVGPWLPIINILIKQMMMMIMISIIVIIT